MHSLSSLCTASSLSTAELLPRLFPVSTAEPPPSPRPHRWNDWMLTLAFSFPVILIDEVLKFFGRMYQAAELKKRLKQD